MLILLVFGPLALVGAGVVTGIFLGWRAPKSQEAVFDSYDGVDYAWLDNALIMPEIVPAPAARRLSITNTLARRVGDTQQPPRVHAAKTF